MQVHARVLHVLHLPRVAVHLLPGEQNVLLPVLLQDLVVRELPHQVAVVHEPSQHHRVRPLDEGFVELLRRAVLPVVLGDGSLPALLEVLGVRLHDPHDSGHELPVQKAEQVVDAGHQEQEGDGLVLADHPAEDPEELDAHERQEVQLGRVLRAERAGIGRHFAEQRGQEKLAVEQVADANADVQEKGVQEASLFFVLHPDEQTVDIVKGRGKKREKNKKGKERKKEASSSILFTKVKLERPFSKITLPVSATLAPCAALGREERE